MRVSRLMLVTLRDIPADAEISSHQLLLRGGYIRKVSGGIYAYLPLMWRVLKKITAIVQQEMDAIGALETLLPQLQPAELWQRSGRWQSYTAGEGIMFNLLDRQGRELGLGPTHEEVITSLAGDLIRSYRQLPVTLYQIQSKFRDEIRPRFGLMRGREFIMKDAYSFHADAEGGQATYADMDRAYRRIFDRCGVESVAVEADSGAIGGAASQEFMVTADAGEDLILISRDGSYAANQEKAISVPSEAIPLPPQETCLIKTPKQRSIETLCKEQKLLPEQVVKVLVFVAGLEDGQQQPVLVNLRGDQVLNETKLINTLSRMLGTGVLNLAPITKEQLDSQGLKPWPFGSIGPNLDNSLLENAKSWNPHFLRLADATATELASFVCGANEQDHHWIGMTWNRLGGAPESLDLRNAQAGDHCLHDPKQTLETRRGIEVGHIFQLGQKYSQALGASFTTDAGSEQAFWMGCYGIGISRLAQAAVEQHHDQNGICWPVAIAPFEVVVVVANLQDEVQLNLAERLYKELGNSGLEVLLDDRSERAGVKFKDADLIGIPWRIVVGRDASKGQVELVRRADRQTRILQADQAVAELIDEIPAQRCC